MNITININGESVWLFDRIECVFRGHQWQQAQHSAPVNGNFIVVDTFMMCGRCSKENHKSTPKEGVLYETTNGR